MYEPKQSQSPTSDSIEASYTSLLFNRKLTVTEPPTQDDISEAINQDDTKIDIVLDKEIESPLDDVFDKEEETKPTEGRSPEEAEAIPAIEVVACEEPAAEIAPEEVVPDPDLLSSGVDKPPPLVPEEEKKVEEVAEIVLDELKLEDDDEEEEEEGAEGEGALTPVPRRSVTESEQEEEEEEENEIEEVVEVKRRVSYEEDHHLKILEECRLNAIIRRESFRKKVKPVKPKDVESHFMQIGVLFKGECFGLG